jgi:hypothetical protein
MMWGLFVGWKKPAAPQHYRRASVLEARRAARKREAKTGLAGKETGGVPIGTPPVAES